MKVVEKFFLWVGGLISIASLLEFILYIFTPPTPQTDEDVWTLLSLLILSIHPLLLGLLFYQLSPKSNVTRSIFGAFLTIFYALWIFALQLFYQDYIYLKDGFGILEAIFWLFDFVFILPATLIAILLINARNKKALLMAIGGFAILCATVLLLKTMLPSV